MSKKQKTPWWLCLLSEQGKFAYKIFVYDLQFADMQRHGKWGILKLKKIAYKRGIAFVCYAVEFFFAVMIKITV